MSATKPSAKEQLVHDELIDKLPPGVTEKLGCYVYMYIDPRTTNGDVFYVGKGKNKRILAHQRLEAENRKTARIEEIRNAGFQPRLEVLAHKLKDEETAYRVEAAVIDALKLKDLTNEVRGWQSVQSGRMTLRQLIGYYAAPEVTIDVPAILIRVNRLYRHDMPASELYEATRGVWKLSSRRAKAQYAFAVFESVVREVYTIEAWHPAGTTPYVHRDGAHFRSHEPERWEFTGKVARDEIRNVYVDHSVAKYFKRGQQSPVVYVNA